MFKVNYRNTRKRCKICSKLTIKIPEWHQRQLTTYFTPFSSVSTVDLEQVNVTGQWSGISLKKHGKLKKCILWSQKTAKYSTRLYTFNSFAVLLSYDNLVILNFFLLDLMLKGTILCHQPIWSSFHKTVFSCFCLQSFFSDSFGGFKKELRKEIFLDLEDFGKVQRLCLLIAMLALIYSQLLEIAVLTIILAIFIYKVRERRLYIFFKIGVLKNFATFTGKHLYWSSFY